LQYVPDNDRLYGFRYGSQEGVYTIVPPSRAVLLQEMSVAGSFVDAAFNRFNKKLYVGTYVPAAVAVLTT
jgi:hypothetical protein